MYVMGNKVETNNMTDGCYILLIYCEAVGRLSLLLQLLCWLANPPEKDRS